MSKSTPIRFKRPLSPTADTSIDDRRKMLRTNYEHAEDDKKILSLTPLQNAEIIRQLVNSIPSAREAILGMIPSLPRIPTRSRFFASEVEELVPFLSGQQWTSYAGCCSFAKYAVKSMVQRMELDMRQVMDLAWDKHVWYQRLSAFHGPVKSKRLNYADGSRDDYLMDMCIAIMDIGLLLHQGDLFANFDDRNRADDIVSCLVSGSRYAREHIASKEACGDHLAALVRNILWMERSEWSNEEMWTGDWILALLYRSRDGSAHPFRSAVSRYIILPPLLPPKSPNDPWTMNDPLVRSHTARLLELLNTLPGLIESGHMLVTEPSPMSGLDDLALSDTNSPVQEPETD